MIIFNNNTVAKSCDQLKYSAAEGWLPLAYVNKNEYKLKGVAFDVFNEITKELGLTVNYTALPWPRALFYLEVGKIDLVLAMYKTTPRTEIYQFSKAYFHNKTTVFTLKDRPLEFNNLSDILLKKGLVPLGGSFGDKVDQTINAHPTQFFFIKNKIQMVGMLQKRRADYMLMDYWDGLDFIKRNELENELTALTPAINTNPVHFAFSKRSNCAHLLERFDRIITRLTEAGTINRWGEQHSNR